MTDHLRRAARLLAELRLEQEEGRTRTVGDLIHAHGGLASELRLASEMMALLDQAGEVAKEDAPALPHERLGEFRLIRELGRGGMGVVYEAEQVPLRRRVALKVLYPAAALPASAVERFRREAHATGLLRHSQIVSVLALGEADGVWYYAMDLVRGRTLAAVIADLRSKRLKGFRPSDPGDPAAWLDAGPKGAEPYRRIAAAFADLADALQHAHDHGILHRDIKPSNVMVDSGGLKLTDFGLARVNEPGEQLTRTGEMVGTPAYMSPEQIRPDGRPADGRADVYSIGATLYELLTLRPAFDAPTYPEVLVQVVARDPVPPTRLDPRIPGDLGNIVLRCLEKAREHRYRTAGDLSRDLRAFADGRPVQARPVGWFGKAVRRARRHPRAARALALLALALGGAVLWLYLDARARTADANARILEALAEARTLRDEAATDDDPHRWGAALAAARRAAAFAASADAPAPARAKAAALLAEVEPATAAAEERARRAAADAATVERLEASRLERADDMDAVALVERHAEALRVHGIDLAALTPARAAERVRKAPIRADLLVALYEWNFFAALVARASEAEIVRQVIELADDDPWRRRLREAEDVRDFEALAADPTAAEQPTPLLVILGEQLGRRFGRPRSALRLFLRAHHRRPGDFWVNFSCGVWRSKVEPPAPAEQVAYYRAATALRPGARAAVHNLAEALLRAGDLDEAERMARHGLTLRPGGHRELSLLGGILVRRRADEEAEGYLRRALERQEPGERSRFWAAYALGICLARRGDAEGAEAALREAIACDPTQAEAHVNLGALLGGRGDEAAEETHLLEAVRLKPDLVQAHYNLAILREARGDLTKAETHWRDVLRTIPWREPRRIDALRRLGALLHATGRSHEALGVLEQAAASGPASVEVLNHLFEVRRALGDATGAAEAARQAVAAAPDTHAAQHNLALALLEAGAADAAWEAARRAVTLAPADARSLVLQGDTLLARGDPIGAAEAFRAATVADAKLRIAWSGLAQALHRGGDVDGAIHAWIRAVAIDPSHTLGWANLGSAFLRRGHLAAAVGALRLGLSRNPTAPELHQNLGHALRAGGDMPGALAAFREAARRFRQVEERGRACFGAADCLLAMERWLEALAEAERGIFFLPEDPQAHLLRSVALGELGHHTAALEAVERALALGSIDPRAGPWRARMVERLRQAAR